MPGFSLAAIVCAPLVRVLGSVERKTDSAWQAMAAALEQLITTRPDALGAFFCVPVRLFASPLSPTSALRSRVAPRLSTQSTPCEYSEYHLCPSLPRGGADSLGTCRWRMLAQHNATARARPYGVCALRCCECSHGRCMTQATRTAGRSALAQHTLSSRTATAARAYWSFRRRCLYPLQLCARFGGAWQRAGLRSRRIRRKASCAAAQERRSHRRVQRSDRAGRGFSFSGNHGRVPCNVRAYSSWLLTDPYA